MKKLVLSSVALVAMSACGLNSHSTTAQNDESLPRDDEQIAEVLKILEAEFFLGASDADITTYDIKEFNPEKILEEKKQSETFTRSDYNGHSCGYKFSTDNKEGLEVLGDSPWNFGNEKLDQLVNDGKVKNIISVQYQNGNGESENCDLNEIEIYFEDGQVFSMFYDGTT